MAFLANTSCPEPQETGGGSGILQAEFVALSLHKENNSSPAEKLLIFAKNYKQYG